jgi:hypothetical protein
MNETQHIELYLTGALSPEDKLVMEANLLLDSELKEKLIWQDKTYSLVREYGRRALKTEIERIQTRMFSEKRFMSFRKKIAAIFK